MTSEGSRPDVEVLQALLPSGTLTCDLSDASDDVRVLPMTFAWRSNPQGFCGPAHTVMAPDWDLDAVFEGIRTATAGSVLVIATEGAACAIWGENATREALRREVVGVVLDGACRDVPTVKSSGLAVVGRGSSPKRGVRSGLGKVGEPITVHGVAVSPGDFIVSDENGTVVLPHAQTQELVEIVLKTLEEVNP